MIADRNTGVERTSTLQGQKIAMGLDMSPEALAFMMRSWTDLYTDQELACIREYSTNASDAHVMAGVTRPIEVELPGPLSPFLTIRDFGIGLTVDDIVEVYSKYGASTKRDSNEVQGMLGFGCKAALSYTPQFTVTSVKDGVRVQMAVSREADGTGSMQIVDTSTTDAGNGTTIQIPVRRENEMEAKARLFFSFWESGSVLVNGKAPERVEGLPVGDSMVVFEGPKDNYGYRSEAKSYVVMGKVAYPVARFPGVDLTRGYGLVAFVPIGAVNFVPSREGLMESDPTTQTTLNDIGGQFNALAPGAIQDQIDKETEPAKALATMVSFQALLPGARRGQYTFKGQSLPTTYRFSSTEQAQIATRHSHALSTCSALWEVAAPQWGTTLWFEGHDGTKFTPTHKKKILQWCDENGHSKMMSFVMLAGKLPADIRRYVAKDTIVAWQDVKAVKLPVVQSNAALYGISYRVKNISGSYGMWVDGEYHDEKLASEIDGKNPVFFCRGSRHEIESWQSVLTHFNPKCTVVHMGENRLAKFQRDFPKAQNVNAAVHLLFEKWIKTVSADPERMMSLAMADAGRAAFFAKLDILQVNDPAIKTAIRIAKMDLTRTVVERKLFGYVIGRHHQRMPINQSFKDPMARYPLAACARLHEQKTIDHLYIYVNAAYAARKGA
jgi:hypothetical protein